VIVLDASAALDFLLNLAPRAAFVEQRIIEAAAQLAAPHLLDAEVAQVLRRYVMRGELSANEALSVLADLGDLPIVRYPHGPFLERAFELRDNATIYDALYLALAESLGAPLLTSDKALAAIPGLQTQVVLTE
jgi:predicted nucleic acid-binding protein